MQQRVLVSILVAASAALISSVAFAEGNAATGKQKAAVCAACHGADGNAVDPQYPRLAGQYQDYIERALHEYKNGKRDNAIMKGMAANLSDQDIEDVAAYFSSLPGKLSDLHDKVQGGN